MKMYGFEFNPDVSFKSFEERLNYLRKIGKKADNEFKEKYENISSWFKEYDPVYLLSFCASYFLAFEEGYDEEVEKGYLEFPPHFQEILQAFSLYANRTISAKPLFNEVGKFKKTMREIGDLMVLRMFDVPEKLKTEEEVTAHRLRTEMMAHTLAVRGWAYDHQMQSVIKDLCTLIKDSFIKVHGVSPWSLFKLFPRMMEKVNEKINRHRKKMSNVLSKDSYTLMCETYESEFPHLIKMNDQTKENLWKHFGQNLEYFKAAILSHSDLCLDEVFTFSADEIVDLSENELSKEQIICFFDKLSYCFGDLKDFTKEHIILDNPIHNKPFIKIENDKYFSSVWGLFPHICIKILENFVNDNEDLSNNYKITKAEYLENELENLFKSNFPDAQIFRGNIWKNNDDNKEYENDLLVIVDSFAIVVEAKSGVLSSAAKRGAPDRLFKNLQGLIEEPSEQALRFIGFLKQHNTSIELLDKNHKKFTIPMSKVKYYIPLGVTFSQLGIISSNLKLLIEAGVTTKKINELTTSINLTDLQTVFELLPSQALKIHYLQRRREFEANIEYTGDEMDLLAFYLDTGFNLGTKEFEDKWYLNLVLKSKELDPYMTKASYSEGKKPQIRLTSWWKDILDFIDKRKPEKWLETSFILLNLNYEEQVEFENLFKSQIKNIRDGKTVYKHNWIIFSSANPKRRFVVIGYPYQDTQKNERNLMIGDMIFNEDKKGVKGSIVVALDLQKGHYPYSTIATKLSTELFDSQFL